MGNCQASEAATVVIQHPNGMEERAYWSLSAGQVMASNPGHYVAIIPTRLTAAHRSFRDANNAATAASVNYQKLLRPDDTLHIGHVYRLVSFEEVLKEFGSKHLKLSRVVVEQKAERKVRRRKRRELSGPDVNPVSSLPAPVVMEQQQEAQQQQQQQQQQGQRNSVPVVVLKNGQWRPTLQSIAEVGI